MSTDKADPLVDEEPIALDRDEEQARKNQPAIALLRRLRRESSDDDEHSWLVAKRLIEENRSGPRRVFRE